MVLLVVAVVVGATAGRLLPPVRHRHAAPEHVRWVPALVVGAAAGFGADWLDGGIAVAVAIAGQAALLAGVLANRHIGGTTILAAGLALNLGALVVDRGVPIDRDAIVTAGLLEPSDIEGAVVSGPRHLERPDDRLAFLGDALPVAAAGTVVSIGDVVVLAGLVGVGASAARRRVGAARTDDDLVVIDLRDHVLSDEEAAARFRHPTARTPLPADA